MYRGMSDYEGYFRLVANNVYTNCMGRVQEVQTGRYCKIKLISATEREIDLPIVNVPIGRWIGTSSPVQVGMVIPVYFSKWALDQVILQGTEKINGEPTSDLQFTRDNAYALPIVFDERLEDSFPEEIRFHQRPIFEEGAEFTKDIQVNDKINATGDIESLTKVKAPVGEFGNSLTVAGVEQAAHDHGGVDRGPDRTDPVGT